MLEDDTEGIPQNYTVSMTTEWTFPDGASASPDAYVQNLETNDTPVYFDVVREDTGETIYQSPVLALGANIEGIKLDTELPAGTYDCIVTYHLIDDEQNTLTTVNMGLIITVLE